jgi:hypothetical protein
VNAFHLFVVFLDGAQGAVEEPGLPELAVGAPALVDRAHRGKDADRKIGGPRRLLRHMPRRASEESTLVVPFLVYHEEFYKAQ